MHWQKEQVGVAQWREHRVSTPQVVGSSPTVYSIYNRKESYMTKEEKLALMKDRYNRLSSSPKNIKCGGVLRRLSRQIRNLEKGL